MTDMNPLGWSREEIRDHLISTIAEELTYYAIKPARRPQLNAELTKAVTAWADAHSEQINGYVERLGIYVDDLAEDRDLIIEVVDYAIDTLGVDYLRRTRPPLFVNGSDDHA